MKEKIVIGIVTVAIVGAIGALIFVMANSAACSRFSKSWDSNMNGGLNRKVSVYSYTGEKICDWQGKLDYTYENNRLLFDMDGKRYSVFGGIVVTEEQ
jgi:hypothetical protein